ncbi:uroporphyrinogen decarboxylase/cobalamine-independent methonine synthase family protein [Cellulomonas gilvus]|uniref:Methionine synthase vitamin-B12 independent n=1 Tax=Cellulomonas gilvus (strain ATCC 13127 / NRRL B-14078) TaxID=593907 RepID=F8A1W8_CELGA|nr:hypothetical protein [Cellulomonas gilvus]AEI12912.1 hypothetical protein Celgi_2413 [Cellulomonas gilvus ATCC 13127]
MIGVTGTGDWPGLDVLEAQQVAVGDLVDAPEGVQGLPFVVHLPERGPLGTLVGRALAMLVDLPAELGPHGWKLADRPGADLARGRALLREDGDALAVAGHGYAGPLVVPVLGPVTLAASVYLARGDRVLADAGAFRELTQSLAAGVAEHLAALVRAVPGAVPRVLVHEPLLAPATAGVLPTFSGYARLRSVPGPLAAERIGEVVRATRAAGAEDVAVHGGAAWSTVSTIAGTGADGLAIEVAGLGEAGWERVAAVVEDGLRLWAHLPPQASSQCAGPDAVGQARTLTAPWRSVGLPAAGLADVVLLAGPSEGTPDQARGALAGVVRAARAVAEVAYS